MNFSMLDLVKREVFCNSKDTFKVCIPAVIYIVQNNLFYVAASHLEAAAYMVTFSLYNFVLVKRNSFLVILKEEI